MDRNHFDALTRLVARASSRRAVLAALIGTTLLGHDPDAGVDARGNGNRKSRRKHKQRRRRRANTRDRRREPGQEPAADARQCRLEGHPCEGNQTCCAPFVCVVSGPGNAERCTPCPSGTVYFEGECCTPTTCAAEGTQCGEIDDECGGTLDCGGCTAPETCGGGGTPGECGCTPLTTCPADACTPVNDGCGGTIACECTPGDVCVGDPLTCQDCTFETAQADACAGPRVGCGSEDPGFPQPNCHCVRTTTGGAICTRAARTLCPCDPISEICPSGPCDTDQDCRDNFPGWTHCVPCSTCTNGGRACVTACVPCPTGQRNCSTTSEVCCPLTQSCCRGVCCAPGERCDGPPENRQCVPRT